MSNRSKSTADKIPDDIKVLVVIHPKAISDGTQYALDQFVLRGGKLVAFVDPLCALDRPHRSTGMMPPPSSSTLDKLFKAWGLTFDTAKVVADMEHVAQLQQGPNPSRARAERNGHQQGRRGLGRRRTICSWRSAALFPERRLTDLRKRF